MHNIKLKNVYGVHIIGSSFTNGYGYEQQSTCKERGTAIHAVNSKFAIHKDGSAVEDPLRNDCWIYDGGNSTTFEGWTHAIKAEDIPTPGIEMNPDFRTSGSVQNAEFTRCEMAVYLNDAKQFLFESNTFDLSDPDDFINLSNGTACSESYRHIYANDVNELVSWIISLMLNRKTPIPSPSI